MFPSLPRHSVFDDADVLLVVVNHVAVALNLFLKLLPQLLPCQFRARVHGLLVVRSYDQRDFSVEYSNLMSQFIERTHQVHNASEQNW